MSISTYGPTHKELSEAKAGGFLHKQALLIKYPYLGLIYDKLTQAEAIAYGTDDHPLGLTWEFINQFNSKHNIEGAQDNDNPILHWSGQFFSTIIMGHMTRNILQTFMKEVFGGMF